MENSNNLTPFEGEKIRKIWHDEQWYFSIVDIIGVLTDSNNANRYWSDLKRKIEKESGQSYDFIVRLNLPRKDGKNYPSDCVHTEGVFRLIMSVASPKAEPLKLWLASLGKQALEEAENPELLTERQAELYRAKGYTEEWIGRRVQTIETRKALTDEWKERGVKENQEYSILTATIAKGTFGLTPSEHKEIKGLERQNLRDHMTPIELIFTALGEEATRMITVENDAQGFNENHDAASEGGRMAGDARLNFENNRGKSIVSSKNYLDLNSGENKALPSDDKE
jgi:DNA-damage-inducible protein D